MRLDVAVIFLQGIFKFNDGGNELAVREVLLGNTDVLDALLWQLDGLPGIPPAARADEAYEQDAQYGKLYAAKFVRRGPVGELFTFFPFGFRSIVMVFLHGYLRYKSLLR
jgi:hypothetical protein